MDDKSAQHFIKIAFKEILKCSSAKDLEKVPDILNIPQKFRVSERTYPYFDFNIAPEDISSLINQGYITGNLEISLKPAKGLDPFTNLLFALIWKQGDIKKLRNIIEGIVNVNNPSYVKKTGIVFYHFGKYLTKQAGNPIIDQHVLRAYALYIGYNNKPVKQLRALSEIKFKETDLIKQYADWLSTNSLAVKMNNSQDYYDAIDKVLFAAGKYIKKAERAKGLP